MHNATMHWGSIERRARTHPIKIYSDPHVHKIECKTKSIMNTHQIRVATTVNCSITSGIERTASKIVKYNAAGCLLRTGTRFQRFQRSDATVHVSLTLPSPRGTVQNTFYFDENKNCNSTLTTYLFCKKPSTHKTIRYIPPTKHRETLSNHSYYFHTQLANIDYPAFVCCCLWRKHCVQVLTRWLLLSNEPSFWGALEKMCALLRSVESSVR